jgi:sporulation protein YlmC with PRC-barrel domain
MVSTTMTKPFVRSASALQGSRVKNMDGEDLGKIEEIMVDLDYGNVAYAVLSFGGFLGMGNKLFAVPWHALKQSSEEHEFLLDVDKEILKKAPGFDPDHWPSFTDRGQGLTIYAHYNVEPYWSTR